jgi:hypothetical protein
MSINKRNIDTDELAKPSQGNAMPTGTGAHDVNARRSEESAEDRRDRQMRSVRGRKAGPLPPVGTPEDLCVRDTDEPMTADQAAHLRILCEEAGEELDPTLSRDAADRQIRRLQHRAGYKP